MGGRFCSLGQLYKYFSGNYGSPSPKLNKDQNKEKGLRRKLKLFFPKSGEGQKQKRSSPKIEVFFPEIQ